MLADTTWANGSLDRALSVAKRVERAAFISPTRVEVVLRDRYREDRRWKAALELQDWSWRITEVQILSGPRAATARLLTP